MTSGLGHLDWKNGWYNAALREIIPCCWRSLLQGGTAHNASSVHGPAGEWQDLRPTSAPRPTTPFIGRSILIVSELYRLPPSDTREALAEDLAGGNSCRRKTLVHCPLIRVCAVSSIHWAVGPGDRAIFCRKAASIRTKPNSSCQNRGLHWAFGRGFCKVVAVQ